MSGSNPATRQADEPRIGATRGSTITLKGDNLGLANGPALGFLNPHHEGADDIVGEVTAFEAGTGFMGCDLAYVRYQRVRDGEVHVMPLSTANLELGDRAALLARATRHDEQAAKLRAMADEVER